VLVLRVLFLSAGSVRGTPVCVSVPQLQNDVDFVPMRRAMIELSPSLLR
jgi:hypothetical protein